MLDKINALLAEAGIPLDAEPSIMDGDLSQHMWGSLLEGGAMYGTDGYHFKCERCGKEISLCELEDTNGSRFESMNEAMQREGIENNCSQEVMKNIHLR